VNGSDDTIFAVATGAARAAISVIRVSGSGSRSVLGAIAGRVPPPRVATLARLRDPSTDETLDHALVLFFEAAKSELGEDGVEFHLHGSPAIVAAVLAVLDRQPGTRAAEPGEFARRAFANGKMDLAQLEGLADLIDAETAWQRQQAQRQLSGAMRVVTAPWRAALLTAASDVETAIDFAEDVMLEASIQGAVVSLTAPVREGLRRELAQPPTAERIRDGIQIVIAGPPNAGKSTLLNALVRREAAIVSAVAGTTRDPIEVHLDLGGCPATLVDTAGLRESGDAVERIGIVRARERAEAADLVLWLDEGDVPPPIFAPPVWRLAAKADLRVEGPALAATDILPVSARTGQNLDTLVARLSSFAGTLVGAPGTALLARRRHREAFATALAALDQIVKAPDLPVELIAEELRTARFALDRLIGTVDVEDILGDIFSRFCIGK
jgi:tRNA modification GTPase